MSFFYIASMLPTTTEQGWVCLALCQNNSAAAVKLVKILWGTPNHEKSHKTHFVKPVWAKG